MNVREIMVLVKGEDKTEEIDKIDDGSEPGDVKILFIKNQVRFTHTSKEM